MIAGIGCDIVEIARIEGVWLRQGDAFLKQLLTEHERAEFAAMAENKNAARWLAKRWAAKEAFGKAAGIGIRAPITLSAIGVTHDEWGRPSFEYTEEVQNLLKTRGITLCLLTLSDEQAYAVAMVIFES